MGIYCDYCVYHYKSTEVTKIALILHLSIFVIEHCNPTECNFRKKTSIIITQEEATPFLLMWGSIPLCMNNLFYCNKQLELHDKHVPPNIP